MPGHRAVIIGVGTASSQFTASLLTGIMAGSRDHGLVAVGVYDRSADGRKVRRIIRRRTRFSRVRPINVEPTTDRQAKEQQSVLDDMVTLRDKVRDARADDVMLIFDTEFMRDHFPDEESMAQCLKVFRQLKMGESPPPPRMTAICITAEGAEGPGGAISTERIAEGLLDGYTQEVLPTNHALVLQAGVMIQADSPLARAVGGPMQGALLARSLAAIWAAPQDFNLTSQIEQVRNSGQRFIALAATTVGLSMKRPNDFFGKLLYPLLRRTTWRIAEEQAAGIIVKMGQSLLTGAPVGMTSVERFPDDEKWGARRIHVNIIAPFRPTSRKFTRIREMARHELTDVLGYNVTVGMVKGRPGRRADLTAREIVAPEEDEANEETNEEANEEAPGGGAVPAAGPPPGTARGHSRKRRRKPDFVCQVSLLYGIDADEIAAASTAWRASRAAPTGGPAARQDGGGRRDARGAW